MKAIMVIIDGLADEKIEELSFRTSYDCAIHENLDRLAADSITGYLNACPEGWLPESMPCILNLLGVPQELFPKGRASLELLAQGYSLNPDEVVLRCNLVAVDHENRLASFNGGQLTNEKMMEASKRVAGSDPDLRFLHLSGYRNLIIMKKQHLQMKGSRTYPPHEYVGENIHDLLSGVYHSSEKLQRFVRTSAETLKELGDGRCNYIFYPWGPSEKMTLPPFQKLHKIRGAAVCGAEIAKGIALSLGMFVPDLEGITADIDTDLIVKARTACSLLSDFEFVLVHINGADEASHRCDCREKIRFIERIDQEFIGYLMNHLDKETRILICADHATSPVLGKHSALPVPFILRKGVGSELQGDTTGYHTELRRKPEVHVSEVLEYFLKKAGGTNGKGHYDSRNDVECR